MEQNVIHLWVGIQLPASAFKFREFSTAGLTVTFGGRPPFPRTAIYYGMIDGHSWPSRPTAQGVLEHSR